MALPLVDENKNFSEVFHIMPTLQGKNAEILTCFVGKF